MKTHRSFKNRFILAALLLLIVAVSTNALADQSRANNGLRGKWANPNGSTASTEATTTDGSEVPTGSAAQDPRAIIKEGMLDKSKAGYVSLLNIDTRRQATYRLDDGYRVFNENRNYSDLDGGSELSLDDVPESSIVRLILIEGQVREIILLVRPS